MAITRTVSFRSSAVSTSASLSKAIRDGRYHDLRELMDEQAMADLNVDSSGRGNSTTTANSSSTEIIEKITKNNPLWEPNSRGWTPMHVAAVRSPTMPFKWWRWILLRQRQQQQQKNSSLPVLSSGIHKELTSELWTRKTEKGQTVVELFFRTSLDPLPWSKLSMKERARELGDAMERILLGERINENDRRFGELEKLRQLVLADNDGRVGGDVPGAASEGPPDDVAITFLFWRKLTALVDTPSSKEDSIVGILADLPWCPELVARLAIALFPEQVVDGKPDEGCSGGSEKGLCAGGTPLPLHRCIRSFESCGSGVNSSGSGVDDPDRCRRGSDHGMLKVLCEVQPSAAAIPDPNCHYRLPLHTAMVNSWKHSWEGSLKHLFVAYPAAVSKKDPVTGLPAVCLAGDALSTPITEEDIKLSAKVMGGSGVCTAMGSTSSPTSRSTSLSSSSSSSSSFSCWSYMSRGERSRALDDVSAYLECQKLNAMFEILRRDPSVLTLGSKNSPKSIFSTI